MFTFCNCYHTLWQCGNYELKFSEQNLTVEVGIINYQGCKLFLFLSSDCACYTGVLTSFCVTQ